MEATNASFRSAPGSEDGRLAFDHRDQRIASVTDPEEHVADLRAPLLAVLAEHGQLAFREHGCPG